MMEALSGLIAVTGHTVPCVHLPDRVVVAMGVLAVPLLVTVT